MTLLSSQLLVFSALHRRAPPTLFPWTNPTTTHTAPSLCSPVQLGQPRLPRFVAAAVAEDLLYNAGATVGVLGGGYALVRAFDELTRRNILNQDSNSPKARYFAAFVPLVNCLRLLVNGFSLTSDEGLIKSVTREGDPLELLRGPLYYVMILMLCALVFWRESPVGVVSLAMMCGGDGIADIIGRRYGHTKIPYNEKKSWAGSISMFGFGFLVSIGMLYYYSVLGHVQLDWESTVPRVAFISFVATMVESLPITKVVDDNISVPLVTMALAFFTFHY
ncbi:probable phytol kinase 1, chloroplastic isoform X2 [Cajanus cajan]|uniref:probable phytol kinase 1, chloroplastic isoform X2 n=1 Tax=Cajanus cajan TaxID=3821 RepID=UPI00098DB7AE|nr:probable phytol kinase 1, chloroplastic isoform X2 [Cajanus cajan]